METEIQKGIAERIRQAEEKLDIELTIWTKIFLTSLTDHKVDVYGDTYLFYSYLEEEHRLNENYLIDQSLDFQAEWGIKAVVIGENGIGDYLIQLPEDYYGKSRKMGAPVYIMLHERGIIKFFSRFLNHLGNVFTMPVVPFDFVSDYIYKLDPSGKAIPYDWKFYVDRYAKDTNTEVMQSKEGYFYIIDKEGEGEICGEGDSEIKVRLDMCMLNNNYITSLGPFTENFSTQETLGSVRFAASILKKGGIARIITPPWLDNQNSAFNEDEAPLAVHLVEVSLIDFIKK
jgi:hypothetical protein